MRGSTGVDLFGIIDPQLNWITVPKGKQRVPRKPRTSLIDNKKFTKKKSQISEDIDKGSSIGEMTVSDSEKLGVTILGQRFDGPIEGVPIKKRFQLVKSSSVSLPASASSLGCESEQVFSRLFDLRDSDKVAVEPQNAGIGNSAEVADFSGISILAAAASSLSGDALDSDPPDSTKKEPDNPDGLIDKSCEQRLSSSFEVTGLAAKEPVNEEADAAIVDADDLKENSITPSNKPEDNTSLEKVKSNSRDVRLHWDLNKVMDAWECPLENDQRLQEPALFDSKVDVIVEKLVNNDSCSSSVGRQDIGCMSEPTSEMVSCGLHEWTASCRKEDRKIPVVATSPGQRTNCFTEVGTGHSSAENPMQLSPISRAGSPSCNLDSAAETEGSSSDEVSNRNTCTSEMKSVMRLVEASGNENKGSMDCVLSFSDGREGNGQVPNEEKQSADHSEVSSLFVSVVADQGLHAITEDQEMEIREGTVAESMSPACQTRENVESQHLSVSNDCISGVLINPVESDLTNNCDDNTKGDIVCDTPANGDKATLHTYGQHEDIQSGLGSISASASSLESMHRGADQILGHSNVAENHYVREEPADMEKNELEDGELREPMYDWGIDGNEDGEMEHVDYDTDSKDMYVFEDSSDHLPSAALPQKEKDNSEAKAMCTLSKNIPFKDTVKYASSPSLQSLIEGKSIVGTAIKGAMTTDSRMSLGGRLNLSVSITGEKELLPGKCSSSKRSSDVITLSRISGWDKICDSPDADMEARRGRSNGPNSISPNGTQGTMIKSTVVKGVTLRADRIHPSKAPHRKVGADIYDSRSHNRKDFNQATEGNGCPNPSSFSRNGPSIQMRERNKCGSWADSQPQSGSFQHEAPGYHGTNGFVKHGYKSAAEAALARVAENGLVVAPDGTVVEPDHLEAASTVRASRTSSTSSLSGRRPLSGRFSAAQRDPPIASGRHSDLRPLREISPSRHMPGKARDERYGQRGARYDVSNTRDNFDGPPLPAGNSFYQRDRSYSPHRGSFRIYACQSKSRSRSRTRSPPGWVSPRKRGDNRRSGSPFRRWSRSPPNFRPDARQDDIRSSPGRRSNFVDRAGGDFIPSAKWISDRKDGRDNYRQHEFRKPPGRSPPTRPGSHIHGRPESEEYLHPLQQHGRFRESGGVGKRGRFDRDENRGRDGRFDRFASPPRQNDAGERVKRLHYDADDFGMESSCFQSDAEVSNGGRSRGFNRGIDNDIQRSPRRPNSDRRHFRYDTDAGGAVKHGSYRGEETVNVPPPPGKRS